MITFYRHTPSFEFKDFGKFGTFIHSIAVTGSFGSSANKTPIGLQQKQQPQQPQKPPMGSGYKGNTGLDKQNLSA